MRVLGKRIGKTMQVTRPFRGGRRRYMVERGIVIVYTPVQCVSKHSDGRHADRTQEKLGARICLLSEIILSAPNDSFSTSLRCT